MCLSRLELCIRVEHHRSMSDARVEHRVVSGPNDESDTFAGPRHAPDAQVVLLEKMSREKSSLKLFVPLFKIDNKDLFSLIQNPGPPARAIDALCNQKE